MNDNKDQFQVERYDSLNTKRSGNVISFSLAISLIVITLWMLSTSSRLRKLD